MLQLANIDGSIYVLRKRRGDTCKGCAFLQYYFCTLDVRPSLVCKGSILKEVKAVVIVEKGEVRHENSNH